jgi:hypothetical protein
VRTWEELLDDIDEFSDWELPDSADPPETGEAQPSGPRPPREPAAMPVR